MPKKIVTHHDLRVYQRAFTAAADIFVLSKAFPREEVYSLTSQIRRSSRSVCVNLAEGWRKRRYEKMFASKLSDVEVEGEAAETRFWLECAVQCEHVTTTEIRSLHKDYDAILRTIVGMINNSHAWILPGKSYETEG